MSLNVIFATVGLTLALLAAFAGAPRRNSPDLVSIARIIDSGQDHLSPLDLADRLFDGKQTIRLIDMRDSASYTTLHIPRAERMALEEVLRLDLRQDTIIVLYSEEGIHASQAWILLKMKRVERVYTLSGGFAAWRREVMYPLLANDTSSHAREENERRETLSRFFGGVPERTLKDGTAGQQGARRRPKTRKVIPKQPEMTTPFRYHC